MNYIDGEKVPEDVQRAVDAVLADDAIYGRADGGGDEICERLVEIAIARAILAERRRCAAYARAAAEEGERVEYWIAARIEAHIWAGQ